MIKEIRSATKVNLETDSCIIVIIKFYKLIQIFQILWRTMPLKIRKSNSIIYGNVISIVYLFSHKKVIFEGKSIKEREKEKFESNTVEIAKKDLTGLILL